MSDGIYTSWDVEWEIELFHQGSDWSEWGAWCSSPHFLLADVETNTHHLARRLPISQFKSLQPLNKYQITIVTKSLNTILNKQNYTIKDLLHFEACYSNHQSKKKKWFMTWFCQHDPNEKWLNSPLIPLETSPKSMSPGCHM